MYLRDENGRFVPGTQGGPGRPRRAVESDYLRALSDACPPEVWAEICQRAVETARRGDPIARAWLSRYLLAGATLSQTLTAEERMTLITEIT
ncbi:MAG: hypothetical protein DDG58_11130 [Ardenticatenia bacterium]|jgi:hypothetical protein|nr:MAG: hypothetical protein DDG58_11130 [Ardenticatenia bacterium]